MQAMIILYEEAKLVGEPYLYGEFNKSFKNSKLQFIMDEIDAWTSKIDTYAYTFLDMTILANYFSPAWTTIPIVSASQVKFLRRDYIDYFSPKYFQGSRGVVRGTDCFQRPFVSFCLRPCGCTSLRPIVFTIFQRYSDHSTLAWGGQSLPGDFMANQIILKYAAHHLEFLKCLMMLNRAKFNGQYYELYAPPE
jgi:hypothetical protein